MFDFNLITKELKVFGAGLSNNEIKELEDEYYEKEEVKINDFEEERSQIKNEINKIFSLVVKAQVSVDKSFNKLDNFLDDLLKFLQSETNTVSNKVSAISYVRSIKYDNNESYRTIVKEIKIIKDNIPKNGRSGLSIELLKERSENIKNTCSDIIQQENDYNKAISFFNNIKERILSKPNKLHVYDFYDHIKSSLNSGDFNIYNLNDRVYKLAHYTNNLTVGSELGAEVNQNKKLINLENTLLPLNKLVARINRWQDLFKFITPTVFIELDDFKKEIEHYIIKVQNVKSFQELNELKEHSAFLKDIAENPEESYYIHSIFNPIIDKSKSLSSDEKEVFSTIINNANKTLSENDLKKIVIEELFLTNKSKSFQPKELQTLKFMFKDTSSKDLFMLCRRSYSYRNDLQNFVKFITEINFSKSELQQIFSKNIPNLMKIYEYLQEPSFTGKPYGGSYYEPYSPSDLKEIFYYLATSGKSFNLVPEVLREIHNFDENSSRIRKSADLYGKLRNKKQKASMAVLETRIQDLVYKNIQNNSKMLTQIISNKNYNSFDTTQGKDLYKNYIELNKYNFDIQKLKKKFNITTEKIKELLSSYTDEEYQTYLTTIKDIFDKNVKINVTDPKIKLLNSKIKTFIELLKNTTVYAKYNKIAEPKNEIFSKLSEEVEGFTFKSIPNKDFDMLNKIGVETNCCQFVGGAGSDAAIDSFINSMASVLILEKDNNLISQSYFHYVPIESDPSGPGIILDNVETNQDNVDKFVKTSKYSLDLLYKLYAEKVSKRLNLKYVKCGEQYNKLTSSFFTKGTQDQDYRTFKTDDIYTDFDPDSHLDIYNANNK